MISLLINLLLYIYILIVEKGNTSKKNRNPLNSKLIEWSATKVELAEIQKAAFVEEHQLKLRHLQEKHELMMNIPKAESVERLKFLKKEHEMNISILQEKKKITKIMFFLYLGAFFQFNLKVKHFIGVFHT